MCTANAEQNETFERGRHDRECARARAAAPGPSNLENRKFLEGGDSVPFSGKLLDRLTRLDSTARAHAFSGVVEVSRSPTEQ